MFGFVVGALSLFGLLKVVRAGRWHHGGGHGRWNRGGRRGFRGRWMFRWLFERLETTPGQEKVILESVEQVRDAVLKARSEVRSFGPDVAKALRGEKLDHEQLKQAFLRQDAELDEIRRALLVSLEKIHEALDESQRKELAELIERAPLFGGEGWSRGGYGHGHSCRGRMRGDPMNDASMA
jgi:hypothetical protein